MGRILHGGLCACNPATPTCDAGNPCACMPAKPARATSAVPVEPAHEGLGAVPPRGQLWQPQATLAHLQVTYTHLQCRKGRLRKG
eukprot:scaffold72152_cov22-Tisochrysis_lutea.AAC.2